MKRGPQALWTNLAPRPCGKANIAPLAARSPHQRAGIRMALYLLPIRGAHFRPLAKVITICIPVRTPLSLRQEKDCHYNPNAIMVYAAPSHIPEFLHDDLDVMAQELGSDL